MYSRNITGIPISTLVANGTTRFAPESRIRVDFGREELEVAELVDNDLWRSLKLLTLPQTSEKSN
jgi:hypothetical protein